MATAFSTQAAKGLVFLHEQQLVHFDVKPLNVLVNADNTGKLADVGLGARSIRVTPHRAAPKLSAHNWR